MALKVVVSQGTVDAFHDEAEKVGLDFRMLPHAVSLPGAGDCGCGLPLAA